MFNFVSDRMIQDKIYPALATWKAEPYTPQWREFAHHWPNTVPVELYEHCRTHNVPLNFYNFHDFPEGSFYSVGLGFFNFEIDYFDLMPDIVKTHLKLNKIKILFYYHEGDNPENIKSRLDFLCKKHNLDIDCYRFVSGNTAADLIPGFFYFPDHELLYWHRNQKIPALPIKNRNPKKDFTVLNRTHKWWRATAMTDLWRAGLLDNSFWSYRTDIECGDRPEDNPIEIDSIAGLRESIDRFVSGAPYTCDDLTTDQHNDHHIIETDHYLCSHGSIIFETHFDADGSGGAFLTEKTFKAIKHGHPFILVGCVGSLKTLRSLGYKTFDDVMDNSYDLEPNNTQRWIKIKQMIEKIKAQGVEKWAEQCIKDTIHNQQLFLESKHQRLNNLLNKVKSS